MTNEELLEAFSKNERLQKMYEYETIIKYLKYKMETDFSDDNEIEKYNFCLNLITDINKKFVALSKENKND